MSIAKPLYKRLCIKCCKCHQCCFKIMQKIAKRRTYIIHRGQSKNLAMSVNNYSNTLSSRQKANQQNQRQSQQNQAQNENENGLPPVNTINMSDLVNTITSPKYVVNNAQIHR